MTPPVHTAVPAADDAAGDERPPRPHRRLPLQLAATAGLVVVVVTGALAVATSFGSDAGGRGASAASPLLDGPAPPLPDEALTGPPAATPSHADGSMRLVNFWASWCPPCREEFPVLLDAHRRLAPRGLQVVGVNSQDRPGAARAFLEEMGAAQAFPHVVDADGDAAVDWGVFGMPETFLVDADGTVVAKAVGQLDAAWVAEHVEPRLEDAR